MKTSKDIKARVITLDNLIDYSRGSIVSKTITNKKAGTLTLFAFDAGQGLSEHTVPYEAIVQVVEGKGEFKVGKKTVSVKAGQMIILPANIPHAVKAVKRFKMLLTMIRAKA